MSNNPVLHFGEESLEFRFTVDYSKALLEMISDGNFDEVDDHVYALGLTRSDKRTDVVAKVAVLNQPASTEDVLAELTRNGFRPATLHELMAFGVTYPDMPDYHYQSVNALGTRWDVESNGEVLTGFIAGLGWDYWDDGNVETCKRVLWGRWDDQWDRWIDCFLAIRL